MEKPLLQLRSLRLQIRITWLILSGLNGANVEFIDPSTNDGEYGIVTVHLTTPTGSVVLVR
jgi:hypothetical protein